jgi:hypothetical protein
LFWKKKQSTEDAVLSLDEDDKRTAYRVRPLAERPVTLRLAGDTSRVVDISAGGLGVQCDGLEVGSHHPAVLVLPGEAQAFEVLLEVRTMSREGVCSCAFLAPETTTVRAIERYVLEAQKDQIRSTRSRRAVTDADLED